MKTVLILAGLIALALSSAVPPPKYHCKTTPVDTTFVGKQKKILLLLEYVNQVNPESEYYKIGHTYDVEANSDNYTNKTVVENFLELYRGGFLPKTYEFSVFYDRMREEAIALFELFYYAKDFETFYKTACFARVHINEHMFLYTFYIAVVQRTDTNGLVLPAPYEVYSTYFANMDVLSKIGRTFMQGGIIHKEEDEKYGIIEENGQHVFFSNYSNTLSYPDDEDRIAYFTEDVGLNAYYYYFHTHLPFWWNSDKYGPFKERRGEIYYYFYQQLLARYYLERLTNGLGKIREFSWYSPIPTGYYPMLFGKHFIFSQRPNEYDLHQDKYYEDIRFLSSYEQTFFQYLQQGHFKAFDKEIDFLNPKAVNFVGNYWQTNADLYDEDVTKFFQHSYEITARHVLGGAPKPFNKYKFFPSALDFYQTSLRDPVTYQLYNRIVSYINEFKQYLPPYTQEDLHFVGVKISDVKVEKMITYFDYFNFDASNSLYVDKTQLNTFPSGYIIRQPRLNHKAFSVTIKVKSDVAVDAVFKMFLGPKYDSNGFPIPLEENWNKFFELDWFVHKIMPGQNRVVRKSSEFLFFKDDSMPISDVLTMLDSGIVPADMSNSSDTLPQRLMLPRGTKSGFPLQLFVFVYPYQPVPKELEPFKTIVPDTKPFGYPFDRQVQPEYFRQPNMHFEDVKIYHEGEEHHYKMNIPFNEHIQLVKVDV